MPSAPATPRPVRQQRSLRTQERILAATEVLLAEQDLEQLTMEQIAERAHVSIGAFYKRFRGKSSLLPLVFARVQQQQLQQLRAFLALPEWQGAGLATRIDALIPAFARVQQAHRRLFRALLVGHLNALAEAAAEPDPASLDMLRCVLAWLGECRGEIRHPQPELALNLGLQTVLQILQSVILFDRIPATLGIDGLVAELSCLLRRYLGVERPPAT